MSTKFTTAELETTVQSFKNLAPYIDATALKQVLMNSAHKSHKEWFNTERAAKQMETAIFPLGLSSSPVLFRVLFKRAIIDGRWNTAAAHAKKRTLQSDSKPWVVLVTGVNGIRKTTSVYQAWFRQLLHQALVTLTHP